MKAYFFIDPGTNGGLAVALDNLDDMTAMNLEGIGSLMETLQEYECYDRRIIVEDVPSYVGRNIPSNTSFKLGKSCGLIEGLARGMKLPCELIGPKVWQKGLSGLKGLSGMPRKRVLKEHAERLFPKLNITLKTADAVLIGYHFFNNNNRK